MEPKFKTGDLLEPIVKLEVEIRAKIVGFADGFYSVEYFGEPEDELRLETQEIIEAFYQKVKEEK